MHHLEGLNPPQREAVETLSGPLLVLAGAGTGKTRVVTARIANILSRGMGPENICAVTFTNKAAREMRDRVRTLLKGRDIRAMVISTFHSLGLRVLREFGSRNGIPRTFNIADEGDQLVTITDVLRECGLSRTIIRPQDARWKVSSWKNAGVLPEQAHERAEAGLESSLALVYERYEDQLRRQGLLDFDDLILKPLELLRAVPEVAEELQIRWRYLLVDEYQDTNGCQYDMVKILAGPRRNVCVVGDDDQSIYGWRGADPERILRFTRDFPGASVITLEQNYRSTGRILDAANTLISTNRGRREKRLWSALGRGEPIELYLADDETDEVDRVAGSLMLMRQRGTYKDEDAAILFRANSQCRPLEQALRAKNIPYRVVGTRSFFDRREVRDLLSFLRLAQNSQDDAAFLRIYNTPARGIGKSSLDKVLGWAADARASVWDTMKARRSDLPAKAGEGVDRLNGILTDFIHRAAHDGLATAFEDLIEKVQYRDHLKQVIDDPLDLQTRLSVVDDLVETARHQERSSGRSLEAFLDALSLRESDDQKEDDKGQGVTLLTMHAAKGLEFPVVFIVGVEEGILPHQNSVAETDDVAADDRSLEEERRLFYVGITRARERLFLSYAKTRSRFGRAAERRMSPFLDEIGLDQFVSSDSEDRVTAEPEVGRAMMEQIRKRLGSGGSSPSEKKSGGWWDQLSS